MEDLLLDSKKSEEEREQQKLLDISNLRPTTWAERDAWKKEKKKKYKEVDGYVIRRTCLCVFSL